MKLYCGILSLLLSIGFVKLVEVHLTSTWYPAMDVLLRDPEDIETDLKYWKIIPDLLDEAPKLGIQAWWLAGPEATFGNELSEQEVTDDEPFWLEWKADNETFHTMVMVGIDEKSNNKKYTLFKEKQYWIVGNIKGYDFVTGEYLTEYTGPKPPKGKGCSRYVFLVYQQPSKINFKEPKIKSAQDPSLRTNFSSKAFADKYHLGKPIAVNFFRARHIYGS